MSIEGYSNAYSNNIEGNSTDSILQSEIDLINYNITDITFNGTNKTSIDNDLTITGVLAIPAFSNIATTLTNLNSSVSTINSTLTGISYNNSTFQDKTIIDNNLTIGTSKILAIDGFSNVKTTLENYNTSINTINTTLTDISYTTDTTTVNNHLVLSAGKILSIPSYPDVESTLTSLSVSFAGITGITYDNTGGIDLTIINNNLEISAGKIFSIPNFSNVETTLSTLTTNATGITYSAPWPLFIPQTTINQNLYLATNKRLICDESWTKLYTTHDLTDTIGVGYFKGFIYNNGSIFTLSAVNPINVYDGTSSQINLKFSTREIEFGVDGMNLNWGTITLCTDIQLPTYTSLTGTLDSLTTKTTGMTYLSSVDRTTFDNNVKIEANKTLSIQSYANIETTLNQLCAYSDDFIDLLNNNNKIRWSSNSTLTYPDDEIGHRGIVRLPASDRYLYPVSSTNIFFWQDFKRMDFVFRITFSDTNMFYDIGLSDNNVGTNKSITWRYQNATSPNGWTPRVNGSLLTGWVSSATITTATTNWFYGSFTHYASPTDKYIKFYIKNLTDFTEYSNTGAIETSIDATAEYRPYFRATSTGGGTKYLDIDYVSIEYRNDRPNPQPQYV